MNFDGWQNYPANKRELSQLFSTKLDQFGHFVGKTEKACDYLYSKILTGSMYSCSYYDQVLGLLLGASSISRLFSMVLTDNALQHMLDVRMSRLFDWQEQTIEQDYSIYQILEHERKFFSFSSAESQYRFYQSIYKKYRYLGLSLDLTIQQQIQQLWLTIGEYSAEFEQEITNDDHKMHIKPYRLRDISTEYVQLLPRAHDGCILVYADTLLLSNSHDALARKSFWRLSVNTGYPANKNNLQELIYLRDTVAKKLGYTSFAQLDITYQMAETPENVDRFLSHIAQNSLAQVGHELDAMLRYKPRDIVLKYGKVRPWDLLRLKTHYKKEALGCSAEFLCEFFPVEHVLKELFAFIERFFNIKLTVIEEVLLWDKHVRGFEVWSHNICRGYIIFDIYARKNKYRYTLEKPILPSTIDVKNQLRSGVTVIVSSLLSPWQQNTPLLDIQDIITLAHEIGHGLHTILGAQNLITQSGTAIERDFVESPGQMLEQWILNKRILKLLSCHYKTGRSLTDEEIKLVQKTYSFDQHERTLEQVLYARLSLELFLEGKDKDIQKTYRKIAQQVRPYILFDYHDHGYASFDHLVSYGSRYYSYLWSLRFAQKIYQSLAQEAEQQNSIQGIGLDYINKVIVPGGSKSPWTLLSDFFDTPVAQLKHNFLTNTTY